MLSASFTNWALALNPIERVIVAASAPKRNESVREFLLNRSSR